MSTEIANSISIGRIKFTELERAIELVSQPSIEEEAKKTSGFKRTESEVRLENMAIFRAYLDNPQYRVYVARTPQEKVIGVMAVQIKRQGFHPKAPLCAFGSDLAVDPAYRRQGIARKMFHFLMDELRRAQVEYFTFTVRKDNERALPLYLDEGCQITEYVMMKGL